MNHRDKPIISQQWLRTIVNPSSGQVIYYDARMPGFGVRLTKTKRTYIVEKRLPGGKMRRVTIGDAAVLVPEQARRMAQQELGRMAAGIDPVQERLEKAIEGLTLEAAFDEYLKVRGNNLKTATLQKYRQLLDRQLGDWKQKPIRSITEDMVLAKHRSMISSKTVVEHGRLIERRRGDALANLTLRLLNAVLNYSRRKHKDSKGQPILLSNPVDAMSRDRAWSKIPKRDNYIPKEKLKAFYEALKDEHEYMRDCMLVALLTGLRKEEVCGLGWHEIDFESGTISIPGERTKNSVTHSIPVSSFVLELLKRRRRQQLERHATGYLIEFVFPSPSAQHRFYWQTPGPLLQRVAKTAQIENLTMHSLRRTFATHAHALIPYLHCKRLLNHTTTDVTAAHYVVLTRDALRESVETVTAFFLAEMGLSETNYAAHISNV